MAYTFKTKWANKSNYGDKRSLSAIKYIVIHYTANDGDTDENNGIYFTGANRQASSHLFVDSDSVTQSVPYDYSAWHCGGGLQGAGGHTFYGKCKNANSIGIELCDDVKNGVIYPSAKTIENAIALTKDLMAKFNIPASNVIRHYDVTGKICPAYWCGSAEKNNKWKTEFWNKLSSAATGATSSTASKPTTTNKKPSTTVKAALKVDGSWGTATTTRAQQVFKTTVDGIVSNQPMYNKRFLPNAYTGSWKFYDAGYKAGSNLVRAIQKWCGADRDGLFGKATVKAFQTKLKKLGYYTGAIDGSMGHNTVCAFQKWLNKQ